jgi:glyoxylase-like metal-dependent hydrolase (beta-lactamase superfamily II)/rhodanese-related sulfurtransferase
VKTALARRDALAVHIAYDGVAMITRQLFDLTSFTHTYVLVDERTREAVVIDSVFEQHVRDAALVRELGVTLRYAIDTHCHADHVTGAWLMKRAFGAQIGLAAVYGAAEIDRPLGHGDVIAFGDCALEVRAVPGHTDGCLAFVAADRRGVFTGDALLVRGAGRTDFQQGDAHQLFRSIRDQLFTLPDDCIVYPGHDYEGRTSSTIGEERRFNARIGGGAREEDFVGYMTNLGLPHPKQLAVAVPANLRAGKPEVDVIATDAAWGPIVMTYAGIAEIAPEWLAQRRGDVQILDVRNPSELGGELGHLRDALAIPLDELRARVDEVPRDKPVVVVCQTGRRSCLGTVILRNAGIARCASLSGGMVRWQELGLPLAPH